MIRIGIVEDEKLFADQIKGYLEDYSKERGCEICYQWFTDGEDIAADYKPDFDVILMDIQMRFMDGMTAAEKIRERDPEVILMFITNRTDYAIKGYSVNALDYILKPISYFSFCQKLDKAVEKLKKEESRAITIAVSDGVHKVELSELYYIESQGHTLVFCTKRGEYKSRGKMKEAEEMLLGCGFFRSNKGYLVNLKHVDGIQDGCCLIHGEKLPVSRARRAEFLKVLTEYIGGMKHE